MGLLSKEDVKPFIDNGFDVLIETGTGPGAKTVLNIHNEFKEIHTIEISESVYNSNEVSLKRLDNVYTYLGDSGDLLKDILEKNKDKKCVIWLDAHFSGGNTGLSDKYGECPIIEEIKLLKLLDTPPIVLIDDVQYFLAPPPATRHKQEDWPTFNLIMEELRKINKNYKEENVRDGIYLVKY